jgi:uracil phosphoribosyltransferase
MNHLYGEQFSLVSSPVTQTLLARLCHEDCRQPEMNRLVEVLYRELLIHLMNSQFPSQDYHIETRMKVAEPKASLEFQGIDQDLKAVVVNLARAGTYPSHVVFEFLHHFLSSENIRQDHIFASRKTDAHQSVVGTDLGLAKMGKSLNGALVVIPDPMGATGNTICETLQFYKEREKKGEAGAATSRFFCLHLIVTPEYLKKVNIEHPDAHILALRVDRGLSPDFVLQAPLGKFWDQEKGLNKHQYIVPGAGGFGELMNNCYEAQE